MKFILKAAAGDLEQFRTLACRLYKKRPHKNPVFSNNDFVWALFPWSIGESNPWPQQCECCALPTALIPLMDLAGIEPASKNLSHVLLLS